MTFISKALRFVIKAAISGLAKDAAKAHAKMSKLSKARQKQIKCANHQISKAQAHVKTLESQLDADVAIIDCKRSECADKAVKAQNLVVKLRSLEV